MNSLQYSTVLFTDVWKDKDAFLADYNAAGIPTTITTANATTLYYLLYARYGNNPIANLDTNQWKYKMLSVIFQYGPTWEKKLGIQASLRSLTDPDLMQGSRAIYNHAFNPSEAPATDSDTALSYINDQNTSTFKKGPVDAYNALWNLLATDVTEQFLTKFKICFKKFVMPERPLLFEGDDSDD